ncbi:UDP-glucuronosyltransferase 2B15-like isoform X2 [Photinus pyralis]|uniref:UDP-glucuronosyltransferase 2B15-like isoform X2 n=1 Tax=Photinus pyralis TaxID=7054 RepID=UPI001266EC38|nr:UDP-glucuronosyltransferase 2B15-like isoform X2 [Photinus pyralis]
MVILKICALIGKDLTSNSSHFQYMGLKKDLFTIHSKLSPLEKIWTVDTLGITFSEKTLNDSKVQALLKSNAEFDAVIVHQFATEAYKGFCYHFKAPCISVVTMLAPNWINPQMGNPGPPSYVPELFVDLSSPMSFLERCYNTFAFLAVALVTHLYTLPKHNQLLQTYFPNPPNIYDVYYNSSLILVNSHLSINSPVPSLPNIIDVAGYHVNEPKPLPDELRNLMDRAKNGIVYFSMGSNLQSKDMPVDKLNMLLSAFAKLDQTVLWKWEDENLVGKSENIVIRKWWPQQDILVHPNVKLFITHGGLLSTIEAVYHGVPILGIPVFGDQETNLASVVKGGYGLSVHYNELSEDALSFALEELLKNPTYSRNVKQRSKIMHDQPMRPLDTAIYWIEYVIRYQGADHLKSVARSLSWYQYFLLDVILASIVLVYLLMYLTKCLFHFVTKNVNSIKGKHKVA